MSSGQVGGPRRRLFLAAGILVAAASIGAEGPSLEQAKAALAAAAIPREDKAAIGERIDAAPDAFIRGLAAVFADRAADPMLFYRVDKQKALPKGYAPSDLVSLDNSGLSVNKPGQSLRSSAYRALKAMSDAAQAESVTLLVSSSYRSYAYQAEVWNRGVASEGEAVTSAGIARPGHSQHQLGEAIDFGSITEAFAETKAGRWLAMKARGFGFSLSYPKGKTGLTGYEWEPWHYRYVGAAAAALEGEYFLGLQAYLLLYLDALWERA
jgi:zinc D-Ala-D-Ala carboxypeptidase